MKFTKEEQFELLIKYNTGELEEKFGRKELPSIFDISKDEYYDWETKQSLRSSVRTKEETYDGIYFIEGDGEWEVYWKERGGYNFGQYLKTKDYIEARYFLSKLIIPYYVAMPKK